jgi:hypothetical protein
MKATISNPTYILWSYDNLDVEGSWNHSVATNLQRLAEDIENIDVDVVELDFEKADTHSEDGIGGFVGYSILSPSATDSFYVDFSVKTNRSDPYDYSEENVALSHILQDLDGYVSTLKGYTLSRCRTDIGDDLSNVTMRAFFVKQPSRQNKD